MELPGDTAWGTPARESEARGSAVEQRHLVDTLETTKARPPPGSRRGSCLSPQGGPPSEPPHPGFCSMMAAHQRDPQALQENRPPKTDLLFHEPLPKAARGLHGPGVSVALPPITDERAPWPGTWGAGGARNSWPKRDKSSLRK